MLLLHGLASGQTAQDSIDLGGGEDAAFESPDCAPVPHGLWCNADSVKYIPAHELYGSWETDDIFRKDLDPSTLNDTVVLDLTHLPCDHAMPVCGALNSPFGPRRGRMHYGVDLDLETGTPVVAAFEGMVRIARYHRSFGNVIVLRHANGLETLYAHLSRIDVQAGSMVDAGYPIGLGGSTGRSTGSHLHFEVRYLGQPMDPATVFDLQEGELVGDRLALHKKSFSALGKTVKQTGRYHVIRKGDTLYAIARKHGTSVQKLCKLNGLRSGSTLRIGQRIRLS
ncbi:MAG: peptidoglycan DD-metalloendopeptidase family protein [Flavobacteriales bacterium]|nr:MAG: peptidoglycan DD-metalloendopeptidase family protein [Flavobacteriales bacterium]